MEYLYADCGTLNFPFFSEQRANHLHFHLHLHPSSPIHPSLLSLVLDLPLLGFDTFFTPPSALYFHWLQLRECIRKDGASVSSFWSGAISLAALSHIEITAAADDLRHHAPFKAEPEDCINANARRDGRRDDTGVMLWEQ